MASVSAGLNLGVMPAGATDVGDLGSSSAVERMSKDPRLAPELERLLGSTPGYVPTPPIYFRPNPYPPASLRDYAAPRLAKREADAQHPGIERLFVESPAMRRVVQVQVQHAKDRGRPAPMLYLLDGVTAPKESGWLREGNVQQLSGEQVTAIMPTEATGSNYTNWQSDDPILGRMQWETFLTSELPTVLEKEADLKFNGTRYIGGVSMGGSAAVRLANLHPDLYRGTFGFSGCYSPTSTDGRGFLNLINTATGGNPDNQWGPGVSAERRRNDVTANPSGLRGMPVYLFAADGEVTQRDKDIVAKDGGPITLTGSVILEKLVNQCTHDLDDAMRAQGMTHQQVTYLHGGTHNWPYYAEQLPIAWRHISGGGR
ncbi:alpha/beta hydrolase family protein [Corynebacterium matruchotii]|uniref:alpha/beta hydrolase n=1 Tax=Corynebacterium matruchotii TaxID=43768 RepID=UPI0028ED2EA1|nr:alpha/beta hydrolase family protein [Corynebacterium matruchotii]